jgi:hypothetical protein
MLDLQHVARQVQQHAICDYSWSEKQIVKSEDGT